MAEKGSLTGADRKIYWVVGSAVEDCDDVERVSLFVELGCVFKLRWEGWEEILSSTAVWVRMVSYAAYKCTVKIYIWRA